MYCWQTIPQVLALLRSTRARVPNCLMGFVSATRLPRCCCMLGARVHGQSHAVPGADWPDEERAMLLQHPQCHGRIEDISALLFSQRTVGLLRSCKSHNRPKRARHQTLRPPHVEPTLLGLQHRVHQSTTLTSARCNCELPVDSSMQLKSASSACFSQHSMALLTILRTVTGLPISSYPSKKRTMSSRFAFSCASATNGSDMLQLAWEKTSSA